MNSGWFSHATNLPCFFVVKTRELHVVLENLQSDDQCDLQHMPLMVLAQKAMFFYSHYYIFTSE